MEVGGEGEGLMDMPSRHVILVGKVKRSEGTRYALGEEGMLLG